MKNFHKTAFSLIEISVVILIIGILIAGVSQGIDLYQDMRLASARSLTQNSRVNRIKDLALWLESTQEISFLKNEAKDGVAVTKWNDINLASIDRATTSFSGTAPIYRQNSINALPAIQFSGNGCFIINHVATSNNNLKTMFAVFLENKKNTSSGTYLYDNNVFPPQFAFILTTEFAGQLYGGTGLTSGSIPLNKPHILTAVHNTANSFFRIIGVQIATGNAGSNNMGSSTRLGGGGGVGGCTSVGDSFYGYIGEFIVFDRVLNAKEYLDVETYLSKKWSIKIN